MNMLRSCYVSRWQADFDVSAAAAMVVRAAATNDRAGVTGGLVLFNAQVVQVLEGRHDAVFSIFQRILRDPRHTDITLTGTSVARERLFPKTWMCLIDPAAVTEDLRKRHGLFPDYALTTRTTEELCAFVHEASQYRRMGHGKANAA